MKIFWDLLFLPLYFIHYFIEVDCFLNFTIIYLDEFTLRSLAIEIGSLVWQT